MLLDLNIAKIKCSIETNSSFLFVAIISASFRVVEASRENISSPPVTLGKLWMVDSNIFLDSSMLTFNFFKINGVTFSSTSRMPLKWCSFSSCCCPNSCAISCAFCKASCDFIVNLFMFIVVFFIV